MVELIKRENVQEICCIELPKDVNYADFMLLGTCVSEKHLSATFINLNRHYKRLTRNDAEKRFLSNRTKLGKQDTWCAMDLGRLVVHLFVNDARAFYDLETLWTCGAEFDETIVEFRQQREELERSMAYIEVTDQTTQTQKQSSQNNKQNK